MQILSQTQLPHFTGNKALVSSGTDYIAESSLDAAKLPFLSDVTSNIQAQLNNKQANLGKTVFAANWGNGSQTSGWCKLGTLVGDNTNRFLISITGKGGWNDNNFASQMWLHGGTNYIGTDNGQIAAGCKWLESAGSSQVATTVALVRQSGYPSGKFDLYILLDANYVSWTVEVMSINSWTTAIAWQQADPGTGTNVFRPTKQTIWDTGTLTNLNQLTNGPGFISGNQTITITGDASGSGTTSLAVTNNKVVVNEHSTNNTEYPIVWDNTTKQLFHTAAKATFNPSLGRLTATAFAGPLTGNASTAAALQTARTLTIGNTGKTFNGTANVSWSIAEIVADGALSIAKTSGLQAALDSKSATGHTHDDRYFTETEADGRYLGKTAKAADAELIDGIDSDRLVYGGSNSKTTGVSSFDNIKGSGFYDSSTATDSPAPSTWTYMIQSSHTNNPDMWKWQLASNFQAGNTENYYTRVKINNIWNPWRKIWTDKDITDTKIANWDSAYANQGNYLPLSHSIGSTDAYTFSYTEGTNAGSLNLTLSDDNDGSESFLIKNSAGAWIANFYSNCDVRLANNRLRLKDSSANLDISNPQNGNFAWHLATGTNAFNIFQGQPGAGALKASIDGNGVGTFSQVIVGGNAVWHAGNFNPSSKVDLVVPNTAISQSSGFSITSSNLANAIVLEQATSDGQGASLTLDAYGIYANRLHVADFKYSHLDASDHAIKVSAAGGTITPRAGYIYNLYGESNGPVTNNFVVPTSWVLIYKSVATNSMVTLNAGQTLDIWGRSITLHAVDTYRLFMNGAF